MSIERILELLHKNISEEEEVELDKLMGQRRKEQTAAVPRPSCCAAIQKYPVITFSVNDDDDTATAEGSWRIRVGERFHSDFFTGDICEYISGFPNPEYCPFCGSTLPNMVRKDPPPPNICRVTDGGYYCDTCKERLNGCICDPPAAAFEPERPLKTIPTNRPPFEES
jgi:hypothetical protein